MCVSIQTVAECEDFPKVTECLPILMEGLQMIWVLSRFYCSDEQMVPLLERIAWSLCDKARGAMDNAVLFRKPVERIFRDAHDAREMLLVFKVCYMDTRERIEQSGKSQRWEFDRKKLFGESDYIASVCQDMSTVAEVISPSCAPLSFFEMILKLVSIIDVVLSGLPI